MVKAAKACLLIIGVAMILVLHSDCQEVIPRLSCVKDNHIGRCLPDPDNGRCFGWCKFNGCKAGGHCVVHKGPPPNHFCRCFTYAFE